MQNGYKGCGTFPKHPKKGSEGRPFASGGPCGSVWAQWQCGGGFLKVQGRPDAKWPGSQPSRLAQSGRPQVPTGAQRQANGRRSRQTCTNPTLVGHWSTFARAPAPRVDACAGVGRSDLLLGSTLGAAVKWACRSRAYYSHLKGAG